ncbi:hypothetical protein [Xenorhabdus doucetiae]|uniref:hypothetical protein n=1 Tax=Xenorhabdus doucetiae TaxID=351671 RepID=UPI002B406825|nr:MULTISPECIES: hypothetical protein [unclassified Xenorhabdus]
MLRFYREYAFPPELEQHTLKDPYIFDFLTLSEPFKELEIELLKHLIVTSIY